MVGRLVRNGAIVSGGTYTPTLTGVSNVAATTAFLCRYVRVGNQVTVAGQVNIDPTLAAPTATSMRMSLPVASNLANNEDCCGVFATNGFLSSGAVSADAANNEASFQFDAASASNTDFYFTFNYLVI